MAIPTVDERFAELEDRVGPEEYNYAHFQTKHGIRQVRRTAQMRGVMPGEMAPDFELSNPEGSRIRLSELRGKPVLLTFSSYT
jgi:cytochrome oxidase Cu insertion factor (SCO1/SenC/PrrC family)